VYGRENILDKKFLKSVGGRGTPHRPYFWLVWSLPLKVARSWWNSHRMCIWTRKYSRKNIFKIGLEGGVPLIDLYFWLVSRLPLKMPQYSWNSLKGKISTRSNWPRCSIAAEKCLLYPCNATCLNIGLSIWLIQTALVFAEIVFFLNLVPSYILVYLCIFKFCLFHVSNLKASIEAN